MGDRVFPSRVREICEPLPGAVHCNPRDGRSYDLGRSGFAKKVQASPVPRELH